MMSEGGEYSISMQALRRRHRRVSNATGTCVLIAFLAVSASHRGDALAADTQDLRAVSALEALAERVSPAVVQIFTTSQSSGQGVVRTTGDLVTVQRTSGSGVILDQAGYIVTNAHVVAGARHIRVQLNRRPGAPGQSILTPQPDLLGAQLVGLDRETDLAALKIERSGLPAIAIADSDDIRMGQLVLAFGSPRGLQNSVTMGVVSAVARQLTPDDPMIYLQTDAPINPGSSGGPLIDTDGRLVGINTLIVSQSGGDEGLGFAAPANIVRAVFEQIRRTGRVHRGEIGVSLATITPLLSAGLSLPRASDVIVADVRPRGPSDTAGLRVGDIVLTLDGKPMENARQLLVNLYPKAVGERVTLDVLRGDLPLRIPIEVSERPSDPRQFEALVDPTDNLVPRLGILALSLEPAIAERLPLLRLATGVVVAATAADVPDAGTGGFQPGDVIYAVNNDRIHSLEELQAGIANFAGESSRHSARAACSPPVPDIRDRLIRTRPADRQDPADMIRRWRTHAPSDDPCSRDSTDPDVDDGFARACADSLDGRAGGSREGGGFPRAARQPTGRDAGGRFH